jgi:hypothetical protein
VLNGGTFRGGAWGFKLETLSKLRDCATAHHGYSILDFAAKELGLQGVLAELESLRKVGGVDFDTARVTLQEIMTVFQRVDSCMPEMEPLASSGYVLSNVFGEFRKKHWDGLMKRKAKSLEIDENLRRLAASWDEPTEGLKASELLGVFAGLRADLEAAELRIHPPRVDKRPATARTQKFRSLCPEPPISAAGSDFASVPGARRQARSRSVNS